MNLTHYTNYALRVLMYLDIERAPVRIADIAARHQISHNHLVKIVNTLSRHGYVTTTRGRGGGVTLARPATTITVGEIVRLTEDHMNLVECFGATDIPCRIKKVCQLRDVFGRALSAFYQVLDTTTIADIAANKTDLIKALGIDVAQNELT